MDPFDHGQSDQEDCSAEAKEHGQEVGHRPLIGEVAGDFDLERVVGVIGDQVASNGDILHNGVHDCGQSSLFDCRFSIGVPRGREKC